MDRVYAYTCTFICLCVSRVCVAQVWYIRARVPLAFPFSTTTDVYSRLVAVLHAACVPRVGAKLREGVSCVYTARTSFDNATRNGYRNLKLHTTVLAAAAPRRTGKLIHRDRRILR